MYIHLHIVFGSLHVTMAELSSHDQDGIVYRAQTICYQTLYTGSLRTLVLHRVDEGHVRYYWHCIWVSNDFKCGLLHICK